MQTRRSKRKMVSLIAEYKTGGIMHPVFIGNASEEGMHMVTLNRDTSAKFLPGDNVELKLRLSSRRRIPLSCEVRWVSDGRPPYGITHGVGLRIIDPPPQYVSFVKSL